MFPLPHAGLSGRRETHDSPQLKVETTATKNRNIETSFLLILCARAFWHPRDSPFSSVLASTRTLRPSSGRATLASAPTKYFPNRAMVGRDWGSRKGYIWCWGLFGPRDEAIVWTVRSLRGAPVLREIRVWPEEVPYADQLLARAETRDLTVGAC